ncbi:MAG: hypothetical protein KAQ75_00240 [Bacteroidales bacterium]|nr:hypothetical protein [Bacteroidales bacterium]
MKLKTKLLSIVILLISTNLIAQEDLTIYEKQKASAKAGYIITKNNEYKGVRIFKGTDKDNSEYVIYMEHRNAPVKKYSKYDISEYGYEDVVYETVERNGDIVFMRRMNDSIPYLYYYKSKGIKEFYIKSNEQYELLPQKKKELVNSLNNRYQDCSLTPKITKLAIYNKKRLNNVITHLNNCDDQKIPLFKIGAFYNLSKAVDMSDNIDVSELLYSYGLFLDIPFSSKNPNVSFHPELELTKDNEDVFFTNVLFRFNTLRHNTSFYNEFGFSYITIPDYFLDGKILYAYGLGTDIAVSQRASFNLGIRISNNMFLYDDKLFRIQFIAALNL